jgi:hypothetical protein
VTQSSTMRPRMSPAEIALLDKALDSAQIYLEFGSGGTTLKAARKPHLRCYSVEADKQWIKRLMESVEIQAAVDEGRLDLFHADIGPVGMWSLPIDKTADLAWGNYSISVWGRLPSAPDLVLVDGRFRLACCIMAFLACPPETKVLLHDFGSGGRNRANYALAAELAEITHTCGSLVVLQRRMDFDYLKAVSVLETARKDFW